MIVSARSPRPVLLLGVSAVMVTVTAGDTNHDTARTQLSPSLTLPSFFDFKKEIANIFPDTEAAAAAVSTAETRQAFDYELQPGVTLERDYDFYSDDSEDDISDNDDDHGDHEVPTKGDVHGSGSAQVTVRTGFFPVASQRLV